MYSLGVLLYELLAGERAFVGETSTDVIAKVLEREPALEALPVDAPPAVRRLLRRCLEKDPRRRLRDIGDARLELAEAMAPYAPRETPDFAPALARRRRPAIARTLALDRKPI